MKKLLKNIDEAGGISKIKGSTWPKSARTQESIETEKEMILTQKISMELKLHQKKLLMKLIN